MRATMIPHSGHLHTPGKADASNRRKAGRVVAERIKTSLGEILDFSSTGMRLYSSFLGPKKGGNYAITVFGPDDTFVISGKVVWVRKVGLFAREIGFEYYGLDERAREGIGSLAQYSMKYEMGEPRKVA